MIPAHSLLVALAAVALLLAGGCDAGTPGGGSSGEKDLTVLAAASLTEAFTDLEKVYEREHEQVDVRLVFDSSAVLAAQVVDGAPADLLATADASSMRSAVENNVTAAAPTVFATNTMVLVVPADNPADITRFADIDDPEKTFLACDRSAPCGALAEAVLDVNDVSAAPASFEAEVKAVLTKVMLDEADAGLVYLTDALAAGPAVRTVQIPNSSEAVTSYLIAPLAGSDRSEEARRWVRLVSSPQGRQVLSDAGFGMP